MKDATTKWTKEELQTYILLLCANADNDETEEELDMILNKVSKKTFVKMYKEFKNDTEEKRLKRISQAVNNLSYSHMELTAFRREIYEIFFSDCDFKMMEKRLDWTLDNILC